ncbi:MAG: M61 family metallopeptidase [Chitinophagaceae bacterium]|nr:M61 family metallopeptidase [Chitinophagaceae bacterium]
MKRPATGLHVQWLLIILFSGIHTASLSQKTVQLHYAVSIPQPASHAYEVELHCNSWKQDTILLKMPRWMPGYYQIIEYAKSVGNLQASNENGKSIAVEKVNDNTWKIAGIKNRSFVVKYTVATTKQFVANSYVDSAHAYLIPENTFLYVEGHLNIPVSVSLSYNKAWTKVATGLDAVAGKANEFTAPDFDILYDCPILIGNLDELPSFSVRGIEHRFIGYNMGNFDRTLFMNNLKKTVEAAVNIIGDIPYKQYTFMGIGPGRGGIEHLNNTTVSFDGSGLDKPGAMNRVLNFLAHEYFHHYNVKRIRPFELGPFDYDKGNRTNLLWISEGLSVYYEYLIVKRAGLTDAATLLLNFNGNLNNIENNPGRLYQSLQQASYRTWSDGPFGTQGDEKGKTISYYDKGPLVGMLFDFEIRNATENKKSLDDVMRLLYWKYYKEKQRGFTEAEFQAVCEQVAGIPLSAIFEYVYSTKELDYTKYLGYAGLKIDKQSIESNDKGTLQKFSISKIDSPTPLQLTILKSWLGE